MKKSLFSFLFAAVSLGAAAQCNEIFISEYVEGWSNNKALEIYNPTSTTKNLNGYGLVRFQNGSTSYGSISYLDGQTIAPGQVLVIVLDKQDAAGTGLEAPVWDELAAAADMWLNPTYDAGIWPMYFNGNDAVAIVNNSGNTLIDLFGRIGEGSSFGGWSAYATDSTGAPIYASADHTLIRKNTVTQGVTANPSSFDVFAQWDTLAANTFDHLGNHTCDCIVNVSNFSQRNEVGVYPNPMVDNALSIVAPSMIHHVRVLDATGRLVQTQSQVNDRMMRLVLNDASAGVWIIEVTLNNGQVYRKSVVR